MAEDYTRQYIDGAAAQAVAFGAAMHEIGRRFDRVEQRLDRVDGRLDRIQGILALAFPDEYARVNGGRS